MEQSKSITVLIIDDHPIVREGLTALINRQHDMGVIGEASSGPEGISLFDTLRI
jgi:YesN/AraC family two-component response regulator